MSSLLLICSILVFLSYLDISNGMPIFQGFSVNKGFEFNLKPFEFKPLTFFKEKWSPFGMFGIRKGIVKRDLGPNTFIPEKRPVLVSPAPVFEHIEELKPEERKDNMETSAPGLRLGSNPMKPLSSNFIRIPLTESFKQPAEGLYTNIGRDTSPVNNVLQNTAEPQLKELYGELPPRPVGPIPAQPNVFFTQAMNSQSVGLIPAQTVTPVTPQPPGIYAVQPLSPIPAQPFGIPQPAAPLSVPQPSEMVPLITPPPGPPLASAANIPFPEIPPTEGPFVRGSRLALYFGNVFLQLVSQFLTNARLQFSRSPPPPLPISN